MKVERTTTGVIIREATDEVKRVCLQYFSLPNPIREFFIYAGDDPDSKKWFGGEKDVIYITSGLLSVPNNPVIENLKKEAKMIEPPTSKMVTVTSNREPRSDLQRDCIAKLTDPSCAPKVTVEAKPGTGKEEPYSRKIPTPTKQGYTLMGDLQVGDFVFDRKGRLTKILEIFEQGIKDVYKITFEDGRTAYCGAFHLWTVQKDGCKVWETKSLKELMDSDYWAYSIPTCLAVDYPIQQLPIQPWVMGCYIGCGMYDEENLTIKSTERELIERFAFMCKYDYILENDRCVFYQDENPVKTKDFLGSIHEDIKNHIPGVFRVNMPIYRLNLLQGLIDSRGVFTDTEVQFPTESLSLKSEILWILQSLGYAGIIHDTHISFISPKHSMYQFFTLHSKCAEFVHISSDDSRFNHTLKITKIEYSHKEQCRCIMVDNPEHLYLTENFVVTHNTFMALYSIGKLGVKPLIVAPTKLLKNQWIDNLVELGIDKHDIATNIYDGPEKTFCVVTISSLENCMREDWHGLMKALEKSRFGIKIIDEAHLHLKGVLKFDAICNIEHNWYMSATLGRSDASEDRILNRALKDADRFVGNGTYDEYKKQYVNVYFQDIWYYPSASLCQKYFRYGSKGLVRATYYNMLLAYNDGKSFIKNILTVMKRTKELTKSDKRILVLVPLREAIMLVRDAVKKDPYFHNLKVGTVDGTMSLSDRKVAMESDIIISTSMSMGTGIDLQDLIAVINFDQYASPIITEQICGRLRDRGYECYYIDICDHVKYAKVIESWGRKRRIVMPYFPGVKQDIKRLPNIRF